MAIKWTLKGEISDALDFESRSALSPQNCVAICQGGRGLSLDIDGQKLSIVGAGPMILYAGDFPRNWRTSYFLRHGQPDATGISVGNVTSASP